MSSKRDYYESLGIARDTDARAIKRAFRALAFKYHPDRNPEPNATERFEEIAEAYAVLSDPKKRAAYDARGHAATAGFDRDDLFGGIDLDDLFGGMGAGFGDDLFERFFGRRAGPARGRDIEIEIHVPLSRITSGGEERISVGHLRVCDACRGTGARDGTARHACGSCDGTGRHVEERTREGVSLRQITSCADCGGQGWIVDTPCPDCRGSGKARREETLAVQIPVGAKEGLMLRVPGHGEASVEEGGASGDLFVVVRTAPDPRFERRCADLLRHETISLPDAVLGTKRRLPTLDGDVELDIPPGTQPDDLLRLRGKGLPLHGGSGHGDYLVRIDVQVPEMLTDKERELYERLRALTAGRESRSRSEVPG